MYRDSTVAVVVPAYNEEGFIRTVLGDIPSYVDRVYAINDGSTDGTWAEMVQTAKGNGASTAQSVDSFDVRESERSNPEDGAESAADAFDDRVARYEAHGKFVLVDHVGNFGAGGAIKTGYLVALLEGIDVTVTIDADTQMNPRLMHRVIDPVSTGKVGYAKGSRFLDTAYRREMPLVRRFGNTALTYMTKAVSGYWPMTDSQNGYTAISHGALERIDVEDLFEYYAYCNAVLVRLRARGFDIADVEVPTNYGDETSDIELMTFVRQVTPMLFSRFGWRIRDQLRSGEGYPAPLLYVIGFANLVLATLAVVVDLKSGVERPGSGRLVAALSGCVSVVAAAAVEWLQSMESVRIVRHSPDSEATRDTVAESSETVAARTPGEPAQGDHDR